MSRIRKIDVQSIEGTLSELNSTEALLGVGETFLGVGEEILNYAIIFVSCVSDVEGILTVEQSTDNVDYEFTDDYNIEAGQAKTFSLNPAGLYFRVKFVNNGIPQTHFHLQTIFKPVYCKPSSHKIQESIDADDDAELVKAVLTGEDDNGVFQNIQSTPDGVLKVSDESSGLSIAQGNVSGTGFTHKFGFAPDFDNSDGDVTIWGGAEDGSAWELMQYVYSTTADIDSISSSDASDAQDIVVVGLDANWEEVSQTVTLNGQTRVALTTPLIRCYRAYNDDATVHVGHVVVYVNGALSGGVPTTNADIRAIIDPIDQQTQMAVYTIPAGKTGYMRSWYAATAGANRTSNYLLKVKSRLSGKVFRIKHSSALADNGASAVQHGYVEPLVFQEMTDLEMTVEMLTSGGTQGAVSGGFDLVLVDN